MSYVYLAQPYTYVGTAPKSTEKIRELMDLRYNAGMIATYQLLQHRIWVHAPIVHCHEMAMKFNLPKDFQFWREYNFAMIRHANELIILTIPGWEESRGVREEAEFARTCGIPVTPLSPKDVDAYAIASAR